MLTSNMATPVIHMIVRADNDCPNWRATFQAAGWRPFAKTSRGNGLCTWLLKRGASVFAINQSRYGATPQTVAVPTADAAEVSRLMVVSGLAVPS